MRVYADNAASMRMRESAYYAMLPYLREVCANPSSIHDDGIVVNQAVDNARKVIADCIGADPNEIYFTSGATESNNIAVATGSAIGRNTGNKHIITTAIEHRSILSPLSHECFSGCQITHVLPNSHGIIQENEIKSSLSNQTSFISVMYANNEIGTIQPIREIGKICRERGIIFHTDATQAVGHIPISVSEDNIDLLSFSAHKFGGAKGVGVLYVRKGVKITPLIRGGGQERGMRSGTENVAGIVSMASALKEAVDNREIENEKVLGLRNYLFEKIIAIPGSYLNGSKENRLPNNINIGFDCVEGEALVNMLSTYGIMVSSGSACSAGRMDASHVLMAIGLEEERAHECIRISLSHENTMEEIEYMSDKITECVNKLRYILDWNRK